MKQRSRSAMLWALVGCVLLCLSLAPAAGAQTTQGTVSVSVLDPTGAVVPGAQLKLVDLATNDARQGTTLEAGTYTFVNLNFGTYKLTVSREGFETQTYDVLVQSARTTDVKATLKVGATQTVVQVEGGATPLVETTTNAINTTITTKQIEDLPLAGRNIAQLSRLGAGYNGTWNGLPTTAQGNTVDGIAGNTSRWRYSSGADSAGITPRLENIAEMVVSTDQLDLNQGFGNSTMQITYVTRRGSNAFHGRFYEDFRSSALNATSWGAALKPKNHQNELGASVGGPIFKDKLFFFGSFSALDVPGGSLVTRSYLSPDAQQGIFTYGNGQKVNLFTGVIDPYNSANEANLTNSVLGPVQQRIGLINQLRTAPGGGTANPQLPSDPNLLSWQWLAGNSQRTYYPTFRVDYNFSQNWRLNLAYNQTKFNAPTTNAEHWPADGRGAGNKSNAATASLGLETSLSPTLINQFRGGYLYTAAWFGIGGSTDFFTKPTIQYGYGDMDDYYELPNSRLQPVWTASDNVSWMKGSHSLSFGFSYYRDQNKYWDPPEGYTLMGLWLAEGDPALQAVTKSAIQAAAGAGAPLPTDAELGQAQQLYATLAGRVGGFWGRHAYDPATGQYSNGVAFSTLNELLKTWGMFFQDSYKMRRNLTVNWGLRWDFISPDKDLTGKYHSLTPQDLFGPTGVGKLFQPGGDSLTGTNDPVYTAREAAYGKWNVTPQPAIGIAWTPASTSGFLGKVLGENKTVVRAGYALRKFTAPQQFVWDMGSSYAMGFYQNFWADPGTSGDPGTFMPGSVNLANLATATPQFLFSPTQFDKVLHMSDNTFGGLAAAAIKTDIRQPYTVSWNLGIQRELGASRAIEIRYNGNRTIHQWIAQNVNEVNVFENGFLAEFQKAQNNYNINHAAGVESFANRGLAGQSALPIMTASGISMTSSTFINNLKNGQVGSFANTLAYNRDYYCRLVGSTFGPCGSSYGEGAGYPVNFWMANPYANGSWIGASYMNDAGFSNYNGLQMEFRQRQWHGATLTANYTWSRTLGVATAGDWTGSYRQVTLRNIKSSYQPANTDRNQVVHINATYDLPFGKGKQFLNRGGIVDRVLGGWTASTIYTFQTGSPFRISGANQTFNDMADGGVTLNGVTADDIEKHIGHYFNASGTPYYLDPTYAANIKSTGAITSNTTPGVWGQILWLHGPHQTYTDIGLSKSASITEGIKFKFQTEMLNAFNHPTFTQSTTSLGSSSFGRASQNGTARRIEFRANIEF